MAVSGSLDAATVYYSPEVSSAGDQIDYIKHVRRCSVSGAGIISFMHLMPTDISPIGLRCVLIKTNNSMDKSNRIDCQQHGFGFDGVKVWFCIGCVSS